MYHHIPYERNPLFTGRERLLVELDTFFTSALPIPLKIVALVGMPGIGKTEIAIEYVYRTLGRYQAVVWLNAPVRWQLAQHISQVLSTCGVRLPIQSDEEHIFELFRTWVRHYQPSVLLVLDQITNYGLLNEVLNDDFRGHVLLTHSSRDTTDVWKTVFVKPFDEQESSLFLLRRTGLLVSKKQKDVSDAVRQATSAIHTEFGGHPLALDQVGAYVSETGVRLAEYLALYRQDPRAFLDRRGTASASHPFSAYVVIAAMRQGPVYSAQELLFLYVRNLLDCSAFSPHLPPTLCVSSHLRQLASDPFALSEMRTTLIQNFLMVPLDGAYGKWDLHPLVRTVMRAVRVYEKEQQQLLHVKDDLYEPLDEEAIFQVLIEVQQMKKRLAALQQGDPEMMELARAITTTVLPLKRAVLPASQKKRERAKTRIEHRYSALAHGSNSPLITASQNAMRHYAQELLALMQYR